MADLQWFELELVRRAWAPIDAKVVRSPFNDRWFIAAGAKGHPWESPDYWRREGWQIATNLQHTIDFIQRRGYVLDALDRHDAHYLAALTSMVEVAEDGSGFRCASALHQNMRIAILKAYMRLEGIDDLCID